MSDPIKIVTEELLDLYIRHALVPQSFRTKEIGQDDAIELLSALCEDGWRIVRPLDITSDEYRPLSRFITEEWTP